MIIYQNTKTGFLDDLMGEDLEEIILAKFKKKTGRGVSASEFSSWKSSLLSMGRVLKTDEIPADCGVAVEYHIPQTSKRVDVLITGLDSSDRTSVVIVELKQWTEAEATDLDAVVRTRFHGNMVETSHPSYQAWSYASLLEGFNEAVYGGAMNLHPCAYLHNFDTSGGSLVDAHYHEHLERAPLFLKGPTERERLREFIGGRLKVGDEARALYEIENGRIRPSKSLAESVRRMLEGNPEFVLIDDQKVIFESALSIAKASRTVGKTVILVEGGPGTGKSVVAVNLLVAMTRGRMTTRYVTKNAAPRAVYEAQLAGHFRKSEISNMFTGSGSFTTTRQDYYDALVTDEAHRLNEKSGLFGNLGENQIKEIMNSTRCAIFFLDEDQRVTLKDIGTRDQILQHAHGAGAEVFEMRLASQFRCNGSDGFLAWLDHVLQIRETANETLSSQEFDFQVFDSPLALHEKIRALNAERNRARMVAGYCWDWKSKTDPDAFDIQMPEHGFKAKWNLTKDGGLWMVAPESVKEVGCIHTCQGLEVDYIGVIVGDDLVVRNGTVVTQPDRRARTDHSLKGWQGRRKQDPTGTEKEVDLLIKNTYRTLLTRGMKGCYVYCTDAETAEHFREALAIA